MAKTAPKKESQPVVEIEELNTENPEDGQQIPEEARWYVVHSYSGYENKVKKNLEHRIESMDMQGKIFQVIVPTEEEIELKDGQRRVVERRVFPGYVLVQMIMDEQSWYVVRNTPNVTGFVGMGNKPTPLPDEEVKRILRRLESEEPKIKVDFKIGQKVRIVEGAFAEFTGVVQELYPDKYTLSLHDLFRSHLGHVGVDLPKVRSEEVV